MTLELDWSILLPVKMHTPNEVFATFNFSKKQKHERHKGNAVFSKVCFFFY